jgi:peroxiredoxin
MRSILSLALALTLSPALAGETTVGKVSAQAAQAAPLQKGDSIPDGVLRTVSGKKVHLRTLVSKAPTLLIFYRGSWCPYCNAHLGAIQGIEKDLREMGYQVLAVSPDDPAHLKAMADKDALTYTLLSDSSISLVKKFGLAFHAGQGDPAVQAKWELKLKEASGGKNNGLLPVPAAYLVAKDGKILYSHFDPDFKKRVDPKEVLEAAKGIKN